MEHVEGKTQLTMDLFAPGMSVLHRAGIGGLAATLRWIETSVPPGRHPPGEWEVTERNVVLRWDKPEGAGPLLEQLFSLAFQIDNRGLIHLPPKIP